MPRGKGTYRKRGRPSKKAKKMVMRKPGMSVSAMRKEMKMME